MLSAIHVVMMAVVPCAFSPSGEYFAVSSADGILKLFETATGTLKQEYRPTAHLSATCTCLSWSSPRRPNDTNESQPKKRRKSRKSDIGAAVASLDLLAIGTTSGSILLYSVIKGDLHSQLVEGHSNSITSLCWNQQGDTLYSSSKDQHIVEWDISSSSVKNKWKAGRGEVTSIQICHTNRHLLSAGRTIKLWDLETKQVLKSFTGHASEVFRMVALRNPNDSVLNGGDEAVTSTPSIEGSYFLTAAVGDRLINAWVVNTSSVEKNSLMSFGLPEEPIHIHISASNEPRKPIMMLVVTRSGQLLLFEHVLNGPCSKPVKPKLALHVVTDVTSASKTNGGRTPRPIPIMSAMVNTERERKLLLAHGNYLKLTFENLETDSLEKDVVLVRDDPNKTVIETQQSVSKVKTPQVPSEVKVLVPGNMAPVAAARTDGGEAPSRRKHRKSSNEMTMEERLNAISIDHSSGDGAGAHAPPKADTLATLLAQGLQSKDKKILNHVLQTTNTSVIRNTVRRLPMPVVVPLVQELSTRMHGHAQSGQTYVKWVRIVLTTHTSYLLTFPDLVESLSSLYQMMESRVTAFTRLSNLQGKLHLMLAQVASQAETNEEAGASHQPLLLYQDESSDDEAELEMLTNKAESEENWEDMSDLEADKDLSMEEEDSSDGGDDDDEMEEGSNDDDEDDGSEEDDDEG